MIRVAAGIIIGMVLIGVAYAQSVAFIAGQYQATPDTYTDGQFAPVHVDANGNMKTVTQNETGFVITSSITRIADHAAYSIADAVSDSTTTPTTGGFTFTERLLSAEASHDGQPTDNPILTALGEIDIVKELSPDGVIQAVRGHERIFEVLEAKFPGEVAAELGAAIDSAEMADQEKSEWEATVGRFAGKKAQLGDIWNGSEAFALDGQEEANVLATIRFDRFVPCGARQCVQLDLTFGSGGEAAGSEVPNVFEDAAHNKGQWVGQTGSTVTSVYGKGERVIDHATMDLISEKIERTIRIEVDVPGEGKLPMVIRETSETFVAPVP